MSDKWESFNLVKAPLQEIEIKKIILKNQAYKLKILLDHELLVIIGGSTIISGEGHGIKIMCNAYSGIASAKRYMKQFDKIGFTTFNHFHYYEIEGKKVHFFQCYGHDFEAGCKMLMKFIHLNKFREVKTMRTKSVITFTHQEQIQV